MRKNIVSLIIVLGLALLLAACQTSGPQKTLNDAAKALTDKNSQAFMAQFDMDAFASHELVNLKEDNSLLNFAGDLGTLFGIGNEMDRWLESAMDLKSQYTRTFTRMHRRARCPVHKVPEPRLSLGTPGPEKGRGQGTWH